MGDVTQRPLYRVVLRVDRRRLYWPRRVAIAELAKLDRKAINHWKKPPGR